ncbi:hypothetical protein HPG69_006782 [Diceros bicornis minor]|uniref:Coatomer gamma subunit appendage Ig-like subdomain domain-containing protein n=1 Tax=Diceros bicornis minor TaxID=77932 RepID=A0A7J7EF45_DICBM|nr:hypothetical protein HPG69_006782 [Diceros bicornis minor]
MTGSVTSWYVSCTLDLWPLWLLSITKEPGQGHWDGSQFGPQAGLGPRAVSKQPLSSLVQFDYTNTLNDQTLENVTVQMEPTEAYEVLCYVPARSLPYNQPRACYILVALPKEDPTAGDLSRHHPGLVGALGIRMSPSELGWGMGSGGGTKGDKIYGLMILGFLWTEAVGNILKFLGTHPCEKSDNVPDNKNTHTLLLCFYVCLLLELETDVFGVVI